MKVMAPSFDTQVDTSKSQLCYLETYCYTSRYHMFHLQKTQRKKDFRSLNISMLNNVQPESKPSNKIGKKHFIDTFFIHDKTI